MIQEAMEIRNIGNIRIEYIVTYREQAWDEQSSFTESEELDKRIERVVLEFDGFDIDITSRLKKDEINDLLYCLD
ncbi:MAG: hypothetical protein ACOVNU_05880 [Candidatus Kapaibacteriota bacterium]